jgi:hypothetical protein
MRSTLLILSCLFAPVTYDYTEPFPFQGTLDQVVVDLNN